MGCGPSYRVIQIKILAIQLESGFFGYLKMACLKINLELLSWQQVFKPKPAKVQAY